MTDKVENSDLITIALIIYNLCLIVGTTYLVVAHDWSLWTYLGAIVFMHDGIRIEKK